MDRVDKNVLEEASLLLHHLLNQSLSALDFCILWEELTSRSDELSEVDKLVCSFLESAELTYLDRALALLPEPRNDSPEPLELRPSFIQQDGWSVTSQRIREVSRAVFTCQNCGWEIAISQEHEANTEMRLPFENFICPHCENQPPNGTKSRNNRMESYD